MGTRTRTAACAALLGLFVAAASASHPMMSTAIGGFTMKSGAVRDTWAHDDSRQEDLGEPLDTAADAEDEARAWDDADTDSLRALGESYNPKDSKAYRGAGLLPSTEKLKRLNLPKKKKPKNGMAKWIDSNLDHIEDKAVAHSKTKEQHTKAKLKQNRQRKKAIPAVEVALARQVYKFWSHPSAQKNMGCLDTSGMWDVKEPVVRDLRKQWAQISVRLCRNKGTVKPTFVKEAKAYGWRGPDNHVYKVVNKSGEHKDGMVTLELPKTPAGTDESWMRRKRNLVAGQLRKTIQVHTGHCEMIICFPLLKDCPVVARPIKSQRTTDEDLGETSSFGPGFGPGFGNRKFRGSPTLKQRAVEKDEKTLLKRNADTSKVLHLSRLHVKHRRMSKTNLRLKTTNSRLRDMNRKLNRDIDVYKQRLKIVAANNMQTGFGLKKEKKQTCVDGGGKEVQIAKSSLWWRWRGPCKKFRNHHHHVAEVRARGRVLKMTRCEKGKRSTDLHCKTTRQCLLVPNSIEVKGTWNCGAALSWKRLSDVEAGARKATVNGGHLSMQKLATQAVKETLDFHCIGQ